MKLENDLNQIKHTPWLGELQRGSGAPCPAPDVQLIFGILLDSPGQTGSKCSCLFRGRRVDLRDELHFLSEPWTLIKSH